MEFTSDNKNIVYVKHDNKEHVNAISTLHMKLLPESILTKLGFPFLSQFYYSKLIESNLIDAYLYKFNDKYVGFISCTNDPFNFMKKGRNKFPLKLIRLFLNSFLRQPSNLLLFLNSKNDNVPLTDLQTEYGNSIGQFLSFGVLKEYRNLLDPEKNIRIANSLMDAVSDHFRFNLKKFYFLLVLKSNTNAIKLYERHSGVIISNSNKNYKSVIVKFAL
jgi:ribosomal protein S18 acetylase RimI-like enzyme